MATMTLIGLLTYDENIMANNFHLPATFAQDLKDKILEHITFECAELEIIIPDIVWFGRMLDAWSIVMESQWEYYLKWKIAQDESTKDNAKGGRILNRKSTRTPELTTTTNASTVNQNDGSTTISNSAYNQNDYYPSEQRDDSDLQSIDNDETTRYTGSESYQYEEKEDVVFNIEDVNAILKNGYINIANIICTDFKERFCLMVY